jgi:hypothetical protein
MFTIVLLSSTLAACESGDTRRAPPLSAPPVSQAQPSKPNPLVEAGDAAWKVVTAPASIIVRPKPAPQQPETFDPPALIMTPRNWGGEGDSTDPPQKSPSPPATRPAP